MRYIKLFKGRKNRQLCIRIVSKQRKELKRLLKEEPWRKPFHTAVYEYGDIDGVTTFTAKPKIRGASKWCISEALEWKSELVARLNGVY